MTAYRAKADLPLLAPRASFDLGGLLGCRLGHWFAAPDGPDGEQAPRDTLLAHDLVAVTAHHGADSPADILLGGIKLMPIAADQRFKLGLDE
jgi:hypothetical protein